MGTIRQYSLFLRNLSDVTPDQILRKTLRTSSSSLLIFYSAIHVLRFAHLQCPHSCALIWMNPSKRIEAHVNRVKLAYTSPRQNYRNINQLPNVLDTKENAKFTSDGYRSRVSPSLDASWIQTKNRMPHDERHQRDHQTLP